MAGIGQRRLAHVVITTSDTSTALITQGGTNQSATSNQRGLFNEHALYEIKYSAAPGALHYQVLAGEAGLPHTKGFVW